MDEAIKKADVLIEALPYIKKFRGKTFVIKYGGSILFEETIREAVLSDIVFLYFMGINVVLVHGGGPNISEKFRKLNIKSKFHEGIRITDSDSLSIVEEELMKLNKLIVDEISQHGAKVKGLNGKDDLIYAEKKQAEIDLGLVGQVVNLNMERFRKLIEKDHIIIVAPMGKDTKGTFYNINADEAASFVALKLAAEKLVLLTDVRGVMSDPNDKDSLFSSLKESQIAELIKKKVISKGMIPKVQAGIGAIEGRTKKVHIIDAKIPHALLLEIFTDKGIGTEIVK